MYHESRVLCLFDELFARSGIPRIADLNARLMLHNYPIRLGTMDNMHRFELGDILAGEVLNELFQNLFLVGEIVRQYILQLGSRH